MSPPPPDPRDLLSALQAARDWFPRAGMQGPGPGGPGPGGASRQGLILLVALAAEGPDTAAGLAGTVRSERATVSAELARLGRAGLTEPAPPDPRDGRVRRHRITRKGRGLLRRHLAGGPQPPR